MLREQALDNAELFDRARQGDAVALTELIDVHEGALRAVAYAVSQNRTVMEDVLQDAYVKAFRSIGTLRDGANFRAWMCRIVHNTAIDERRKAARVIYRDDATDGMATPGQSTTQTVEAVSLVSAALDLLSTEQRTIVRLIDGEQFRYEEVAALLNLPRGTVASRAHTARVRLRQILTDMHAADNIESLRIRTPQPARRACA